MIKCKNIGKTYFVGSANELTVLHDINFEITKGEFVAIIGPSGSGKSTLMNILGALDRPTVGEYYLNGKNVLEMSDIDTALIRSEEIGFVFQSFNLLPRATVMRNVMLPLVYDKNTPQEERKNKADKALRAAGLPEDRWYHLSNQLSGGQMQRVAIARSLVNDPGIVLADEPTGNLDSKTGQVVLKTLKELNEKTGHTIILITHDRYVAEHANRIIELKDGAIISDSTNRNKLSTLDT